ncbi:DUF4386 family protein [bacterium]|nr:DUF4386 family protein [bacterium]
MTTDQKELSPRTVARIAGVLYLVIILTAGFSEGFVRASIIVPGDAAATAENIAASEGLFRLGFASDLVAFLCDLAVSILLYVLLKPAGRTLAMIVAAFRLLAHPAIASVNLLNHLAPVLLPGGVEPYASMDPAHVQSLTMLFLELHGYGYLIGGAFFGVHLVLLGYLLHKSELFPTVLGILVAVAGAGYLLESFGMFLAPSGEALYTWVVTITAVAGEVILTLWLLIKGVRTASTQT